MHVNEGYSSHSFSKEVNTLQEYVNLNEVSEVTDEGLPKATKKVVENRAKGPYQVFKFLLLIDKG